MYLRILCLVGAFGLALLAGCSSKPSGETASPVKGSETPKNVVVLADLLAKPRPELAKLVEELTDRVRFQQRSIDEHRLELGLLPSFRLPLVVPVWREAKFSSKAGFSLPPYATEDARDTVLAIHLARFGDVEAARKLAEPADLAKLDAYKYERNYPVEWTRLVALMLQDAQIRTATADLEGQAELIELHEQLRAVLDAKAAKGPLGAVLLPRGKQVLTEAATVWRNQKRAEPATQAEKAIRTWGDVSEVPLPFSPGAARADVERLFGSQGKGRIAEAAQLARTLDLLCLPVPEDGARSVVAFFGDQNELTQLQVTYRDGMAEKYSAPDKLALLLGETLPGTEDATTGGGIRRRTYAGPHSTWEVFTVAHRIGLGAVVRWRGEPARASALARDFGLVNLDRSFEQNRLRLAPEQRGDTVTTKQAKTVAQVSNPVGVVQPQQATLQREPGHDLTARVALQFPAPQNAATELHLLALPMWTAVGPCQFEDVKQGAASHLALIWRDEDTEYTLRLPYATAPIGWEARDRRGSDQIAARTAAAVAFDQKERQARLQAGQPLTRIPRSRERLELGMKREQAQKLLPSGQAIHKQDFPNGILVTLTAEAAAGATEVAKEMVLRFDPRGQLAELRVRYLDGPAVKGQGPLSDLSRRCGASQESRAPSTVVWSDLSQPTTLPIQHQWQDDLTIATCVRDGNATEVVLRERPVDENSAAVRVPLEYLPRGPAGCVLGVARDDLLRQWNVTTPNLLADGALILKPQTPRPHDVLMVWFENDRVARIVARHEASASRGPAPAQLAQAVSEAWGRDLRQLGWPSRQDQSPQRVLQGLGWHDGLTRLRTFWQEEETGPPRVYTEWKYLVNP